MGETPPIVFRQEGAWRVGQCLIPALDKPDVLQDLQSLCETDLATMSPRYVALDFTGVNFMVSTAISMVLMLLKRQRQNGGTLAICGLDPNVARVFKLARLDRVFDLYPNISTLLLSRPQGPPGPADAPPGP